MKNIISICIIVLLVVSTTQAQSSFGFKGGLSSILAKPDNSLIVHSSDTTYSLGVQNLKVGQHFGIWIRFGDNFFFQPEAIFNNNSIDYKIKKENDLYVIKSESRQTFDLPLLVGFSMGQMMLQAGPVGHYQLKSKTDLFSVKGFDEATKQFKLGYQGGVSFGKEFFGVDLRYEYNTDKFGDHLTFDGQKYNFGTATHRFILSINIKMY